MGATRKNPPKDSSKTIHDLASKGFTTIGIAKALGVAKTTFQRWLDEDDVLQEAFEQGREIERQALHAAVYKSAMEGKPANVNAFFLLKSRFGYVEADNRSLNINVDARVQSVMYVADHGTDEEWRVRVAEQQRRLAMDSH